MQPSVLINSKWRNHARTTGVQRYACDLTQSLEALGVGFDDARPDSGSAWRMTLWEQRVLPGIARSYDVLLCPANAAPWRVHRDVRVVLTVHCLRFHFHPESYSRSFVKWYRYMIPRAIERADCVLTVSQTTARQIESVYPQAAGKVSAVYPGISGVFGTQGSEGDRAVPDGAYWVFVGNAGEAKNLRVVLEAMNLSDQSHRVVLMGVDRAGLDSIGVSYDPDRVIALGHVNDSDRVASIYRGAIGLLAPSVYESFDLPSVEAMACGGAVIASDIPVHREVLGEAAVFVDAEDGSAWGEAMDRVAGDRAMREGMIERGVERARAFCWKKSGERIAGILGWNEQGGAR